MPGSSTRQKFIDAACDILSSQNFSDLSIDRISERAGLSRRTFFLHFKGKDELVAAVLQDVRPIRLAKLEEWSADSHPHLSLPERMQGYFRSIIGETNQPGWRGSIFIRLSAEFAELRGHPVHEIVAETYREMSAWFEAEFRKADYASPSIMAEEMMVLLSGLLVRQLVDPAPKHGEAITRMLPKLLSSLIAADTAS